MTKRFTGHEEFDLRYLGKRKWKVLDGFTFWLSETEFVSVPAGFVTDFASIPRLLRVVWESPGGEWDLPAVLHDYVYFCAEVESIHGTVRTVHRGEADQMFRDAMDVMQVRESAEAALYRGVRVGGWVTWRRYRKAEKKVAVAAA